MPAGIVAQVGDKQHWSMMLRSSWQCEAEGGSLALSRAGCPDSPAVLLDDALAHRQAQTAASKSVLRLTARLVELPEDIGQTGRLDAATFVTDMNGYSIGFRFHLDSDGGDGGRVFAGVARLRAPRTAGRCG